MFLPASSDRRVVHVSASLPILRPLRAEVLVVFAALRESDLYGSECTSQTLRSQFINSRSRLSPPAALAWGHHKRGTLSSAAGPGRPRWLARGVPAGAARRTAARSSGPRGRRGRGRGLRERPPPREASAACRGARGRRRAEA
ncbi:unnamed protein product, partial [Prorocentrum cordatum]